MEPDSPLTPGTLPIILDTEIGGEPDDAMALVIAARELPELALVVTTDELGGERARFARFLLDSAGRTDVAVVAGRQLSATAPYFAHGLTPGWVTAPSGSVARAVAQATAGSGGAARWMGLGPLSNLAGLLSQQPGLARRLFVTQLTGLDDGQALPPRNFRLDPVAAQQVLTAARHLRLVSFSLPAGRQAQLTAASPALRGWPAPSRPGTVTAGTPCWPRTAGSSSPAITRRCSRPPRWPWPRPCGCRGSFRPARVTVGETGTMRTSPGGEVLISQDVDYRALGEWLRARLRPQSRAQWSPARHRPLRAVRV